MGEAKENAIAPAGISEAFRAAWTDRAVILNILDSLKNNQITFSAIIKTEEFSNFK